jgi:hypothetical protein
MEEPRREETHPVEPPAFLVRQEPREEAFRSAEPRSEPPAPTPRAAEPRIDAKEILDSAGLVMIETDRSKAPVQPQAEPEAPAQLGRPRRERPKAGQQDDELQQVETKR